MGGYSSKTTGIHARRAALVDAGLALAVVACVTAVLMPLAARSRERAAALALVDALVAAAPARAPATEPRVARVDAGGVRSLACPLVEVEGAAAAIPDADVPLDLAPLTPELASWGAVGGCGVGGGGGGGGVRWVGRRSPGGYVEVEVLVSVSASDATDSTSTTVKVSGDVGGRLNIGLQIPWVGIAGADDNYRELFGTPLDVDLAGAGDLSILVSRKFGIQGDTVASLTIGVPTGVHDAQLEAQAYTYPRSFQIGKGVYTVSGSLEYTFTKDWGTITTGGSLNLNGGVNDIDNRTGDRYDGYAYLGYRTESFVHSVGMKISRGLSKDMNAGAFEADQSRTLVTFQYGIELSFLRRAPVFVGLTATLGETDAATSTGLSIGIVSSF